MVYEEGKSYGITADARPPRDGDKATDSASAGDLTPSVDVTIDSFEVANNGDVAASGTLTATGGNGALTTTLVVKIDGVEYNATVTGTSWSLDAGQSVVYEEGKSYGITADAETTDADGDKATDSASAGDLTPSVDVTIDSFEVANNGDVAASGTLTATGGNGALTTTLVVKIDGVEYNATVTGTSWSLDAGQSVVYEEGKSYGITADAETTDADGDKATDSASAGDLTPSVDVTIDSFEVANNGDVAASGTLTATGGNGALTTTLVVKIDGVEYNATVTGTSWSLDAVRAWS
ncbi:MAG: hypothetical protein R3E57_03730 [Porticoccaceae bacterium]